MSYQKIEDIIADMDADRRDRVVGVLLEALAKRREASDFRAEAGPPGHFSGTLKVNRAEKLENAARRLEQLAHTEIEEMLSAIPSAAGFGVNEIAIIASTLKGKSQ